MADHHPVSHTVDNDYREHEASYVRFLAMAKWGIAFIVALLMFIGSMTSLVPWFLTVLVSVLMIAGAVLF